MKTIIIASFLALIANPLLAQGNRNYLIHKSYSQMQDYFENLVESSEDNTTLHESGFYGAWTPISLFFENDEKGLILGDMSGYSHVYDGIKYFYSFSIKPFFEYSVNHLTGERMKNVGTYRLILNTDEKATISKISETLEISLRQRLTRKERNQFNVSKEDKLKKRIQCVKTSGEGMICKVNPDIATPKEKRMILVYSRAI